MHNHWWAWSWSWGGSGENNHFRNTIRHPHGILPLQSHSGQTKHNRTTCTKKLRLTKKECDLTKKGRPKTKERDLNKKSATLNTQTCGLTTPAFRSTNSIMDPRSQRRSTIGTRILFSHFGSTIRTRILFNCSGACFPGNLTVNKSSKCFRKQKS